MGAIAGWLGDVELGDAKLREGIARWRELGDEAEAASALDLLGWSLFHFLSAGRDDESLAFEESLAIRRQLGDRAGELRALAGVCQLLVAMGEVDRAEPLSLELLELSRAAISLPALCSPLLGRLCVDPRRLRLAEERYRESRAALPLETWSRRASRCRALAWRLPAGASWRGGSRLAAAGTAVMAGLGVQISIAFWDALLERRDQRPRELARTATPRGEGRSCCSTPPSSSLASDGR